MLMIQERLNVFRTDLAEANLDAMLIVNQANIRYLSNYTGDEAFLFISRGRSILITDFRYMEQAAQECPDYQIILHRHPAPPLTTIVNNLCVEQCVKRLAFERDHISYALYDELHNDVIDAVELEPFSGMTERQRYIKTPYEIEMLRHACAATDKTFAAVCEYIRPGVSEKDVARELIYAILNQGCDSSFPVIVASGVNGSLPHAIPTDKLLAKNEFITMDFGCKYNGYHADMTRTVFIGKADEKQRKIYDIVLEAKGRAESLIKDGVSARTVDTAARDFIAEQGYGGYFGHGLGHGVGLEIHEKPILNPSSQHVLKRGCLHTVEPGIYLPGWGGVRVEDTVLVTKTGHENLFTATRELISL